MEELVAESMSGFRKPDKVEPSYLEQLQALADDPEAAQAAREESDRRRASIAAERKARSDAVEARRPESPDLLIGFLADAPEVAQAIRQLAYERRSQAYGA